MMEKYKIKKKFVDLYQQNLLNKTICLKKLFYLNWKIIKIIILLWIPSAL